MKFFLFSLKQKKKKEKLLLFLSIKYKVLFFLLFIKYGVFSCFFLFFFFSNAFYFNIFFYIFPQHKSLSYIFLLASFIPWKTVLSEWMFFPFFFAAFQYSSTFFPFICVFNWECKKLLMFVGRGDGGNWKLILAWNLKEL